MASISNEDTTTTGAIFIPENWSDLVLEFREANLKAANFFERRDGDISDYGDKIHFPTTAEFTAATYTEGEQLEDKLQANTETEVEMDIDQYYVAPFVVSDKLSKQSKYDKKAINYRAAGYSIAKTIDSALLALGSSSTNTDVNLAGDALTLADFAQAQRTLDAEDVPENDRMWFLHPVVIEDMIKLSGNYFTSMDFSGAQAVSSGKVPGLVGMLLGSPLCKTTNIQTGSAGSPAATMYRNLYAHKEAIGCAMQIKPEVQEKYDVNLQGTLCNVRSLYGKAVLRADHMVEVLRTS